MSRKQMVRSFVILVMATAMLTSCSSAQVTPSTVTEETAVAMTETTAVTTTTTESTTKASTVSETSQGPKPSDPEIKDEGETIKRVTFYRDGNPIKAKVYLPKGKGPFKTVIILGGMYVDLGYYSGKAQLFNDKGYAVVEMSPTNNKLMGVYQLPEFLGDFVYEQMQDMLSVKDDLKYFPELDQSKVYLFGHSVGGLGAVYAGAECQDSFKGLILIEPSFQYPETMLFENDKKLRTDFYPLLSEFKIPVLIVKGTGDRPDLEDFPHFYDKAVETIPDAKLITVEGADHPMHGEPGNQMVLDVCKNIKKW